MQVKTHCSVCDVVSNEWYTIYPPDVIIVKSGQGNVKSEGLGCIICPPVDIIHKQQLVNLEEILQAEQLGYHQREKLS